MNQTLPSIKIARSYISPKYLVGDESRASDFIQKVEHDMRMKNQLEHNLESTMRGETSGPTPSNYHHSSQIDQTQTKLKTMLNYDSVYESDASQQNLKTLVPKLEKRPIFKPS